MEYKRSLGFTQRSRGYVAREASPRVYSRAVIVEVILGLLALQINTGVGGMVAWGLRLGRGGRVHSPKAGQGKAALVAREREGRGIQYFQIGKFTLSRFLLFC
jgi:hypothetical protein